MTVHEVGFSGNLRELHAAIGHTMGGNEVNEAFKQIIEAVFGEKVYATFLEDQTADWLKFWAEFEKKKKTFHQDTNTRVVVKFPRALISLAEQTYGCDIDRMIQKSKYSSEIKVRGNEFVFDNRLVIGLFERPIRETVAHVKAILDTIEGVKTIVMVGGFSASPILQNAMKSNFPQAEVISPEGDTVVVGACIARLNPKAITERVLKKTYGVKLIGDRFDKHVEKDQTVTVGEFQQERCYFPVFSGQQEAIVCLYSSDLQTPEYISDSCTLLGEIELDMSDEPGDMDRTFFCRFVFSDTEIKVTIRAEKSGKITSGTCNFLG